MEKLSISRKSNDEENREPLWSQIDDIQIILHSIDCMLGATIYFMGGQDHNLDPPYDDIEMWIGGIQDRLNDAMGILSEIGLSQKEG